MSEKIPPHEAWDRALEGALEDEGARVAKLDDAALARDLEAKGADPARLRAKGEALAAKLKAQGASRASGERKTEPVRTKRRPWVIPAGLGGLALAAAAVIELVPVVTSVGPVATTSTVRPPPPVDSANEATLTAARARALRDEAAAACDNKQWFDCQKKLDLAWQIDPAGDEDPRVVGLRKTAGDALRELQRRSNAKQ
jgi:hypothetical protein